jgi:hypothetical protein
MSSTDPGVERPAPAATPGTFWLGFIPALLRKFPFCLSRPLFSVEEGPQRQAEYKISGDEFSPLVKVPMDHALTAAVTGRVFLRTTTCNPGFFRGVEETK